MAKVERTVIINALVEKVFSYLSEPTNLPEIWPSLVEVKNVQRLPNGGSSYDWVYKMAGMRFTGTTEQTEYVLNQRVVEENKGGIESTMIVALQPEAGGTKVNIETEYIIPVPLLGKLAEPLIAKLNEHEADVFMANLKARMEA